MRKRAVTPLVVPGWLVGEERRESAAGWVEFARMAYRRLKALRKRTRGRR